LNCWETKLLSKTCQNFCYKKKKPVVRSEGKGNRRNARFLIILWMSYHGYSFDEIEKEIMLFNKKCNPPADNNIVKEHIKNTTKSVLEEDIHTHSKTRLLRLNKNSWKPQKTSIITDEDDPAGLLYTFYNVNDEGKFTTINTKLIANHIMRKIFKIKTTSDNETMYRFDKGMYIEDGENKIKEYVEYVLGKKSKTAIVNEVVNHIKRSTFVDRNTFNSELHLINVKNGYYNLNTKQLEPHNPIS